MKYCVASYTEDGISTTIEKKIANKSDYEKRLKKIALFKPVVEEFDTEEEAEQYVLKLINPNIK